MIRSQMKSWRSFAGMSLINSYTIMNSGIEATSKLDPSSKSVFTIAGFEFAFTAK